jgi:hypothetical protein
MNKLTTEQFDSLLKTAAIKPRFKRDIKFLLSTEHMGDAAWNETELLPIWNKSKHGGILLLQPTDNLYMVAFDATKPTTDTTGRTKPVICDLCYTWQSASNGGFVTFYPNKQSDNSTAYLCCMDLACSANVRTKTAAAIQSRAQLREDMTNDDRVRRLRLKLRILIDRLGIQPTSVNN